MHPILARLERLGGYLALWCAGGVFESAVLTQQGLTWPEALVQVLPPLIVEEAHIAEFVERLSEAARAYEVPKAA